MATVNFLTGSNHPLPAICDGLPYPPEGGITDQKTLTYPNLCGLCKSLDSEIWDGYSIVLRGLLDYSSQNLSAFGERLTSSALVFHLRRPLELSVLVCGSIAQNRVRAKTTVPRCFYQNDRQGCTLDYPDGLGHFFFGLGGDREKTLKGVVTTPLGRMS